MVLEGASKNLGEAASAAMARLAPQASSQQVVFRGAVGKASKNSLDSVATTDPL